MELSKNAIPMKYWTRRVWILAVSLLGTIVPIPDSVFSQELALDLRGNIVSITSEWKDQTTENGFGIIVGEEDGIVYIATANHVVRRNDPDDPAASNIIIKFFQKQGSSETAELLEVSDSANDLAVISSPIPRGVSWQKDAMKVSEVKRGAKVWFVGRSGQWYVQTNPGSVNGVGLNNDILIDDLNVQVGTSGGPLISEEGLVGMMRTDHAGNVSEALTIQFIQKAFQHWNLPWSLTEFTPKPQVAKAEKVDECSISGLVFDKDSNKPLASVWIDFHEDKGKRSRTLKAGVATTAPDGTFTINCSEIGEENFPLRIALRHRDWKATHITSKIERPGKWEGINISVSPSQKPLKDLGVSFSSKKYGSDWYITGTMENKSRQTITCAKVKFRMITSFQQRQKGEKARNLGYLTVEVRDLKANESRQYRQKLPNPKPGLAFGSKEKC